MPQTLLNDRKGNVALYFALAVIPIVSLIGFATDASRQDAVQSELQSAVDMTALATTRTLSDSEMTEEQRTGFAETFFAENFTRGEFVTLNDPVITFPESGSVRIEVSGQMSTAFMGIVGIPKMDIKASSRTKAGGPSVLEAALVLDVSHSMTGQPLDDLKTAAKSFVSQVLDATNSDIRVAIVPFSHYVNVGVGHRNASWIDVAEDYTDEWESCGNSKEDYLDAGCVREPYECTYFEHDTGEEVTGTCHSWNCPAAPPEPVCEMHSADYTWFGCIGSREPPYDIEDARWDIDVKGLMARSDSWCPPPIQPLTSSKTVLDTAIDNLTATDETYIAPGIAWGLRVLSPGLPFNEALDDTSFASKGGKRVIVLMSDGSNTRSRDTAGWHEIKGDSEAADTNTLAACTEAKAQGIEIYTIAYRLTDTDTLKLLKDCASGPGQAFEADSAAALMAQFDNIGSSLSELRLAE